MSRASDARRVRRRSALLVSLLLAFFVSPYASSAPDGLDRVADRPGLRRRRRRTTPSPTARWPATRSRASTTSGSAPAWPGVVGRGRDLRHRRSGCSWLAAVRRPARPGGARSATPRPRRWPDRSAAATTWGDAASTSPATARCTGSRRSARSAATVPVRARRRRHAPGGVLGVRLLTPWLLVVARPGRPAAARLVLPAAASSRSRSCLRLPPAVRRPGRAVDVLGLSLSVAGLWAAWNILVKGDAGRRRHRPPGRDHPVPSIARAASSGCASPP